jgi:SPX domain protein involved in polyphosphate accumulation
MIIPEGARQEIKFVTNSYNLSKILLWIKSSNCMFISPYPERWVNNIYFDTYNYQNYQENLSGESIRRKLRYRWYNNESEISPGRLEMKLKRNFFGWKEIYRVMENPYSEGGNWKETISNISNAIPESASQILKLTNFPVIINRYKRMYFISADKKIRVTVDQDQSVCDQRYKQYPNFKKKANLPDTIVIEFKFSRDDVGEASNAMQGFPVRVSKHSKYMNAVDAVTWNRC